MFTGTRVQRSSSLPEHMFALWRMASPGTFPNTRSSSEVTMLLPDGGCPGRGLATHDLFVSRLLGTALLAAEGLTAIALSTDQPVTAVLLAAAILSLARWFREPIHAHAPDPGNSSKTLTSLSDDPTIGPPPADNDGEPS